MKTKKITYKIRNKNHELSQTDGVQINLFVGARHIIDEKNNYWIVDHIQTGGRIFDCQTYSEARNIGLSFTQACSKPDSTDPMEVIDKTDIRFKDYLYGEKFKRFGSFEEYLKISTLGDSQVLS